MKRIPGHGLTTMLLGGLCLFLSSQAGTADPVLDGLIVTNGDFRAWDGEKPADWIIPVGVDVARNEHGEVSFTNSTDQRQYVNQHFTGTQLALQSGDVLQFSAEIMAPEKSAVTMEIWVRYQDESLGKRELALPVPADGKWSTLRCVLPIESNGVQHVWFLIGLRTPGSFCVVRRVEGRVIPATD
ncbi:MAG TPA: hypothetical protein PK379_07550 [Candidatus Hydrogenedentes bacterium]|nr:hypothetical protein [Candidatus Hydrogenedentota bacterium]HOJ67812.1 hypothetical protein [Candidatus Hydrogenedentota bacterium]HOK89867.1 hypothetical protein [Candidatus Hydrogenedentota bacterium]HOV61471.1 hypothetical protein [Candidatus Hydrogenedentota bacterium]